MSDLPVSESGSSACKIALVIDSTCDIPAELVTRYHIKVVPLYVLFGAQSYKDRVEIDEATFYERLQTDRIHPATSQPSPEDFSEAYREVMADQHPEAIICLTISQKFSGTYNSAQKAARSFSACPVTVIDTFSASMGLGLMMIAVAEACEQGASVTDIKRLVQQSSEQAQVFFTPATLDYLHRGGRIGGAQRLLGTALSIKPILGIRDGEVSAIENVRTRKRAVSRLIELARCIAEEQGDVQIAVMSSASGEETDQLIAELQQVIKPARLIRSTFSPVIGVHTGPGTIGLVVLPVKALDYHTPIEEPALQLAGQR